MIVLDTDVVSALMRPTQNPSVVAWSQSLADEVYITTTTLSELVFGVMIMPDGRRKNALDDAVVSAIKPFYDRTIEFDSNAAVDFGRLVGDRQTSGRPIERADAQIAASCLLRGAKLATRNTKDFDGLGLELVNPWEFVAN